MIPQEDQLRGIKKYLTEAVIIALASVVVYLFIEFNNLNSFIRSEFLKYGIEFRNSLDRNTRALERIDRRNIDNQNKNSDYEPTANFY